MSFTIETKLGEGTTVTAKKWKGALNQFLNWNIESSDLRKTVKCEYSPAKWTMKMRLLGSDALFGSMHIVNSILKRRIYVD